jgi:hypothetical protein
MLLKFAISGLMFGIEEHTIPVISLCDGGAAG